MVSFKKTIQGGTVVLSKSWQNVLNKRTFQKDILKILDTPDEEDTVGIEEYEKKS